VVLRVKVNHDDKGGIRCIRQGLEEGLECVDPACRGPNSNDRRVGFYIHTHLQTSHPAEPVLDLVKRRPPKPGGSGRGPDTAIDSRYDRQWNLMPVSRPIQETNMF